MGGGYNFDRCLPIYFRAAEPDLNMAAVRTLLYMYVLVLVSHSLGALETRFGNIIAAKIHGGRDKADDIADQHGFNNMGSVSGL